MNDMHPFGEAFPDEPIVQQLAAQLPWGISPSCSARLTCLLWFIRDDERLSDHDRGEEQGLIVMDKSPLAGDDDGGQWPALARKSPPGLCENRCTVWCGPYREANSIARVNRRSGR
jgi:hypothetical protein